MYGQPHHHHRPRCGPRGGAPPSQPQPPPPQQQIPHQFPTNPNLYIQQNPNFYSQNPAFLIPQNPAFSIPQNPYIQNPTFSIPQNPNFSLQQRPNSYATSSKPNETLDRIEKAIVKAHHNLLLTGETVSAWSVSQSALLYLRVDSWSSLGFQMQQVPSLYHLMVIEGKVNAFIHCFVGARRITSLYDLDVAICKNEGVERFEELKLGPLVRHPLVVHYFSVPSGTKEVHRITTEGIISRLVQFIDGKGKFIQAEEFLQFLATKESVEVKEKLGVRIQSLKLHITSIQDSRKAEESTLKNYVQGLEQKSSKQSRKGEEEFSKPPSIFSQKKVLDKRFTTIAQRIKSFSPIHADFGGKHIRFLSSSSEDENDDNDADNEVEGNNDKVLSSHCKISSQDRQSSDKRVTSCPYPSAAEEMTRLGLKVEMDESSPASGTLRFDASKKSSGKKRKKRYWNQSTEAPSSKFPKRYKAELSAVDGNLLQENDNKQSHDSKIQSGDNSSADEIADLSLTEDMMDTFITTWKDTCRVHSVTEVFEGMIDFYIEPGRVRKKLKAMFSLGRRKEKIKSIFSLYPCIGLLNIAIKSIKCGMWDNLYDTFQTIGQHGCTTPSSAPDTEFEMIDVELSSKRDALPVNGHSSQLEHSVTVDDILKKVGTYFENGHSAREGKSMLEKQLICLRRLRDCEIWLTEQFSVKDFGILGYGEFFKFLEENSSRLPNELYGSSSGDVGKKSLLEVSMLGKQLVMLLSQAASSLWGNDVITKHHIYSLLKKQFPVISLQVGGNDPLEDLSEFLKKQEHSNFSSCVLFSVTLLPSWYENDPFVKSHPHLLEATGLKADLGQKSGALGSVSAKDAIDCLLRAPMLSDLLSWSHWDLTFAPSLGPLVEWLLTEVHTKELLCLVTKDGKIIRIDHSVTVDEFLEAALQGSSFRTAVKLLSLLSLYGGDKHIPLSLLKCHARQAIEVIVKNSLDAVVVRHDWDIKMHEEALSGQQICTEETAANQLPLDSSATISLVENQDLSKHLSGINKTIPVASRFILDCLGYLPSEFCCFAADIFLSGLRSFTKDAPLAILRECTQINQRMMLHDIGLSLGIMEWIGDYHTLNSSAANALLVSLGNSNVEVLNPGFIMDAMDAPEASENQLGLKSSDGHSELYSEVCAEKDLNEVSNKEISDGCIRVSSKHDGDEDATLVIESIRREEFGLVPSLTHDETSMLKKQHARLGRALHCLSQELYSQDSHFLLELVQNADDNIYPESVEPTLVFILQATGIVVLNNEQGFSAQNIRALCDVGNSTKRGSSAGYIGQKGIGFKSVFRVTDAPEIHSNGFHVKFDISEGQIGFVLPTVVSPCDIDLYGRLVPGEVVDRTDNSWWKTCIVLPFKSKLKEGAGMSSIISMFSDLHPSLLLFLHRVRCIKFKNMLTNDCIVMRRETLGNGIVKVSHGKEKMSWFVASQKLQASVIRPDVQTTEIAIAFTLEELANGEYKPHIEQQPVFAFLPLRTYGLKFILQGDFVLPSSREEVDGDSAWNQWLLSEFPGLFVSALRSFCALPCFQESPGKAVVAYMSFVPLVGEVHGFFSHLPRMIISKLRISNCMIIEGHGKEWVPPCRVLRGWDEHAHNLLPESLLNQHLGLGYLDKDIVLSDPLAKALGVQDYGPKILVDVISSICQADTGMKSMGLDWLSSWLSVLYTLLVHSSGSATLIAGVESDLNKRLRQVPFIPLSDGTYSSVAEGPIWLPSDAFNSGFEGLHGPDVFPSLYEKLRTVSPALLSSAASNNNCSEEETLVENCIRMLNRIGVQRLSAHDIIIVHILPAISDDNITNRDKNLMTEYLSFVMLHLQSSCPRCCIEKEHIISELRNKAFVLTNHGYKRPVEVSIHFSKEFGNPVDVHKLIDAMESKWHEVDIIYLKHARIKSSLFGLIKWREFFQELGVTDFVQIIQVEKNVADVPLTVLKNLMYDVDLISPGSVLKDWESLELVRLVSTLSSLKNPGKCEYLLKVLDEMWDDFFSSKVTGCCISKSMEESKLFKSSFIKSIHDVQWIVSSMDQELHYSTDLFHDCEAVRSILGASAPYAVPQVRSRKFVTDMGFKTQVTLDDALKILEVWRRCETPFKTSIAQMSKFYSFIWDGADTSKSKISAEFSSGPSIFVPFQNVSRHDDVVHGMFLSRDNVYWQDPTGSVDLLKKLLLQCGSINETNCHLSNTLAQVYHGLHDFFVNECRVCEIPPFRSYVQILLQLSKVALPSQAANAVFQVILKWADDLKSGLVGQEDVLYLKEFLLKLENTVLPTVLDKWVSLHPTFGLVCWCDDEELRKQFKHSDNISFLYFGELSDVPNKISRLMQTIGVPSLSEVITREAIFYGVEDFKDKASLVDWVLPFAQRYIYKLHPDKYFQLKQSGLENLSQLQIVVVEKLFYRYTLKGGNSASNKRLECSCLLQENVLYVTRDSDSHSIFLELSRLFYHGTPELHLANFLHMITTMAETGSTKEQTEFFIVNSQKIPELPDDELVWGLPSLSSPQEDFEIYLPTCSSTLVDEQNQSRSKRKPGTNTNWPPADWKTAPDFNFSRANRYRTRPGDIPPPSESSQMENKPEFMVSYTEDHGIPVGVGVDWNIQDESVATMAASLQDLRSIEGQPRSASVIGRSSSSSEVLNQSVTVNIPKNPDFVPLAFNERDQLCFGTPNEHQAVITGRLGEFVAFKYLTEKVGEGSVNWVNEATETGLPYDIVIGKNEESKEYIEVKATKSARKDWFAITSREWQFAVEKGESFSVAHVVLMDPKNAKVTVFKNPTRLCQQGVLQLAVLMSKNPKNLSSVS